MANKYAHCNPKLKVAIEAFWKKATPDVMSGDETDYEWQGPANQQPHYVLIIDWRNPEVVLFFRILDALYFSSRFEHDGRIDAGRFPVTRVRSNTQVKGKVVKGLPENFYNPQWLLGLTQDERDDLMMEPPIELDFSPSTLRCVIHLLNFQAGFKLTCV